MAKNEFFRDFLFTVIKFSFKLYACFYPETIYSTFYVLINMGFVCSDRLLFFIYRPVGMPKMEKVYLHNPSSEQISLISISATTAHFHASFFQNRVSTNYFNLTCAFFFSSHYIYCRKQSSDSMAPPVLTFIGLFWSCCDMWLKYIMYFGEGCDFYHTSCKWKKLIVC